jgi:hypothetical protein
MTAIQTGHSVLSQTNQVSSPAVATHLQGSQRSAIQCWFTGASLAATALSLGVLGTGANAQLQTRPATGQLSAPAPGVVCDGAGPVCYDGKGPSIGHTQTYFGRLAADRLTRELAGRPPVQEFRLSTGALCDSRANLCWSDGYSRRTVATQLSQQLYGSSSGGSGGGSGGGINGGGGNTTLGDLQLPVAGVLCDRREKRCYDRQGLSLALTREYYGVYAEQAALRQLGGQQPPKVFRLSNGAVCDVAAQRCWSDGWDRRTVDTTLSRQLFGQGGGAVARQAQCRLTRWFKTLASGNCEIRERTSTRGRKVDVALTDGSVYTFSNFRGEGYRITDGQGATWPVRVSEQGNNLSFSWSDRVLQVTLERTNSSQSLIQLLNTLLGN